jgi:excisionase family DNA binding protein
MTGLSGEETPPPWAAEILSLLHEVWAQMSSSPTPWLTVDEAADYARVSPHTIRHAAAAGRLPGVKTTPGSPYSQWRFKRLEVDEWMERGRVPRIHAVRGRRRRGSAA